MQEFRGSSNRMRFLVMAAVLVPAAVTAAHNDLYQIHELFKNHDFVRHPKREATCQQPGYNLCPASVDGGCCPDGYACAVESCFATTAGPTTACGHAGYYNCPITAGAGTCCPVGYICNKRNCEPPAGVTEYNAACPTSYFGCPSSLGFGCCPNGMQCGSQTCYNTTPQTLAVSGTVTTTNADGDTITTIVTSTEVVTPGGPNPSATSSAGGLTGLPKLIPSTVAKLPAIETGGSNNDNNGGGLTGGQLGGIIGGAIALLIIIIAIAAIILWRLKRTEKAARAAVSSRHDQTSSGGQPRSQKSGFGQPSVSEVDGTDVDSVARRAAYYRTRSPSSTLGGDSRSETPNYYGSNASTTPPVWPVGYFPQISEDGRGSSMDNNLHHTPRPSVESQGSHAHAYHGHSRQHSDVSELDGSVVSAHGVSELASPDTAEFAARRRSNSVTRKGRGEGAAVGVTVPLGTLDEVNEIHGYYGPSGTAAGQTAARLRAKDSFVGSEVQLGDNPSMS